MYCEICGKVTFNKNAYDIIQKKLICNKCIEKHDISIGVTLEELESIVPDQIKPKASAFPFVLQVLAWSFFVFRLIPMFMGHDYYYATEFILSIFMFIVVLSLAKIIKLLENLRPL